EEQAGMHEIPLLALAECEHVAEQPLGLGAVEEVLLVRRALIGVARRHRDADAELGGEVEELCDVFRGMAVEDRGVDVDGEAALFCSLDRRDGAIEHALLRYRLVMVVLQAVEMHGEEQIGRGLEQIELLLQQQRIGAERDELLARYKAAHDLADLLMDQRLAARDRHHRRAAFIGRVPAFLGRHAAVEDGVGIVDLAAADASEVTAEQRFQHQHERIAFAAKQLLLDQVTADPHFLEEGYCHSKFSFWTQEIEKWISPQSVRPEAGTRYFLPARIAPTPSPVRYASGPRSRRQP